MRRLHCSEEMLATSAPKILEVATHLRYNNYVHAALLSIIIILSQLTPAWKYCFLPWCFVRGLLHLPCDNVYCQGSHYWFSKKSWAEKHHQTNANKLCKTNLQWNVLPGVSRCCSQVYYNNSRLFCIAICIVIWQLTMFSWMMMEIWRFQILALHSLVRTFCPYQHPKPLSVGERQRFSVARYGDIAPLIIKVPFQLSEIFV